MGSDRRRRLRQVKLLPRDGELYVFADSACGPDEESGSHMTRRRRAADSNPRSPIYRELAAPGRARHDTLSDRAKNQSDAWCMIGRRAAAAGITAEIGGHTFRATGITAYLANGGAGRHAQEMAAHETPRTPKLYDRTKERLTQDEVERIRF